MPLLAGFYSFVGGGILDKNPKLRAVFLEGGAGRIPWYLERMDHYYPVAEFFRESFGFEPITSKSPEHYKDRVYTTCEAGERLLPQVIDYLGEDNIMVSEDMPHLEAREGFGDDLSARRDITQRQREKILFDNPSKFYGIKVKARKAAKKRKAA